MASDLVRAAMQGLYYTDQPDWRGTPQQAAYDDWYWSLPEKPRTGWRIWRIEDGKLISPTRDITCPSDGYLAATCPNCAYPPGMCDVGCGIYHIPYAESFCNYMKFGYGIRGDNWAATYGDVVRPVLRADVPMFHVLRCRAYQVRVILQPLETELDYPVPAIPWDATILRSIETGTHPALQ